MILKDCPEDFRVMEVLKSKLEDDGPFRVFRVTKRKCTTLEAVRAICNAANVKKEDVSFAGLKDKQGITVQHVSVKGGKKVDIQSRELKVTFAGFSKNPITSESIVGNLFDVIVRGLGDGELRAFRQNAKTLKTIGVPNYFDDQRFGCLRHGQGFIIREILHGNWEKALQDLITGTSPFDSPERSQWKKFIKQNWGSWKKCLDRSRGGEFQSVFEYLLKDGTDFKSAFRGISTSVRLLHLYSYQSYLWNKGVTLFFRNLLPEENDVTVETEMGPLHCPKSLPDHFKSQFNTFPLMDSQCSMQHPEQKRSMDAVMLREGISQEKLQIDDMAGFQFKSEERPLMVCPEYFRAKPALPDDRHPGKKLELRFRLPPGSYATMVVKRLFAGAPPSTESQQPKNSQQRRPWKGKRSARR